MNIIAQNAYHRQRMIAYYNKNGKKATDTAIRYKVSRKTLYKWLNRYDGSLESLKDRSHRPLRSPNAHREEEIKMIIRALKKVKWRDLLLAYQRLTARGYKRHYGSFKRVANRLKSSKPIKRKLKKKPKPYAKALYPGQKVQIVSKNYLHMGYRKQFLRFSPWVAAKKLQINLNMFRKNALSRVTPIINSRRWMNTVAGHTARCMMKRAVIAQNYFLMSFWLSLHFV
jgi:transposase